MSLPILWTYHCLTRRIPLCTDEEARDHLQQTHLVVDFPGRRREPAPDPAL